MTNLTLFSGNMPAEYKELLAQIDPVTSLAGGDFGSSRRISIRGKEFREIINGKEVSIFDGRTLNVVVLNAGPVTRTYYEGAYDENNSSPPVCWSPDNTKGVPSADVPEENKQADRCADCPQNIKGSGQGDTRACRFQQRIAVVLEEDLGKLSGDQPLIYQMQVPATSLFGDAVNGQMPLQAYARFLQGHNTPCVAVVTAVTFDSKASTPKLMFSAVRPLDVAELRAVLPLQKHPEAMKAIEFTVAQQDKLPPAQPKVEAQPVTVKPATTRRATAPEPEPAAAPAATTRRRATAAATAEPVAEPTVRTSRRAASPAPAVETSKQDLGAVVAAWDDQD